MVRAETLFVLGITLREVPFSWADTATSLFPRMFPDSEIAKQFSCKRTKASYMASDGLGPYFRKLVIEELNRPNVFYSIAIDETPLPEQRCQQLDVMVRYFPCVTKHVVVEHLQSFRLGSATADILLSETKKAIQDLPQNNFICFFSDGPNVMKAVKRKLKELHPNLIDVGECCIHKVHNAFSHGIDAFGSEVEAAVVDVYYFFKSAVQSASIKAQQEVLQLPSNVFLRHLSSRWLTLGPALDRLIEQFPAIRSVVMSDSACRVGGQLHQRLRKAFSDRTFYAKLLFMKNAADIFTDFFTLFQKSEPLVHLLYSEMVALVFKLCGRFMTKESYSSKKGTELLLLQAESPANWKAKVEIGEDTEREISSWEAGDKRAFRLGARKFYIKCTEYLVSRLPFDNLLLKSLRFLKPESMKKESSCNDLRQLASGLPQVIQPCDVSALMDEYNLLRLRHIESDASVCVEQHWQAIFDQKKPDNGAKYPLLSKVVKALLCIPHGNADVERGFSVNRRQLNERSRLTIQTVNGIRNIVSFAKRFGSDPCSFDVTPDVVRAVRGASKRYRERLAAEEEQATKRQRADVPKMTPSDADKNLHLEVETAKKMLANAELLINNGVKTKNFGDIESGQALLAEGKTRLSAALEKCRIRRQPTRQYFAVKKRE